ncbi:MAG: 50S ribosomal protein L17, partial [Pirellula sp.]|nr:50S ribosomal protein L17 [Pirellula sp.]
MRHLRKGRVLGRSPSHRKALYRNLASAIFLTERETTEVDANVPKVPGRIITTIEKAKEIRPMVEKCITIARKGLAAEAAAESFATKAERGTEEWKAWRKSENWQKWCQARSPGVTARRRALVMLGDKE